MSVFDFVSQEDVDDLPEDPQSAFLAIVRQAQTKLASLVSQFDETESYGRFQIEGWQHSFMNTVVAAAKHYEIEPIASLSVPRRAEFDTDSDRQFHADLDHYLMQVMLQNGLQRRRESVTLKVEDKDRIRSHIHGLRQCIDSADNITDAKRGLLHSKLSNFEAALEKSKLNILAVSRLVFEVLSVSANIVALNDSPTVNRLIMQIFHIVADAKSIEDENQLPPPEKPKALLPPRQEQPKPKKKSEDFSRPDFDDDIPF